jgi:hypothetical protein
MVSDSLARHGFEAPVDHRRLAWSSWFRCDSSFSLLLVPSASGVYALAEEVTVRGGRPSDAGRGMLAIFRVAEADDLCVALSRQLAPRSPVSARLSTGRCFLRFAPMADIEQRHAAFQLLNRWLASSAEAAAGLVSDFAASSFVITRDATSHAPQGSIETERR